MLRMANMVYFAIYSLLLSQVFANEQNVISKLQDELSALRAQVQSQSLEKLNGLATVTGK